MNIPHGPIGVFDSGYGGLTVLKAIIRQLPAYDYIYLGDNARTPYGTRSFETVYDYTLQCIQHLFDRGCPLVIIACNTASAKALRTIQQKDLPRIAPDRRVLGVIRPTTENIGLYTKTRHIGILATSGTVSSESYPMEIRHFFPDIQVFQQACPMWVPLVENQESDGPGADYFVKKYLGEIFSQSGEIDTLLLGCTHYPLLINKIRQYVPQECRIIQQGEIVAQRLQNYLQRHPEIESTLLKQSRKLFYTTDSAGLFDRQATRFLGEPIRSRQVEL